MPNESNQRLGAPSDVAAIRSEIRKFFLRDTPQGKLGRIKWGVYAFYDYDGEPIYIGQTYEGLASRVGRHLTNQRTDAVAMNVLDPFEVAEICVWPLNLDGLSTEEAKKTLDQAEFALFQKVIAESKLGAVLNERHPLTSVLLHFRNRFEVASFQTLFFPTASTPMFGLLAELELLQNSPV
jgi:hypothetical protein